MDKNLPKPLFDVIAITAYVDSDHAHDKMTRRSMTVLIVFVGKTPVFFHTKRRSAIKYLCMVLNSRR